MPAGNGVDDEGVAGPACGGTLYDPGGTSPVTLANNVVCLSIMAIKAILNSLSSICCCLCMISVLPPPLLFYLHPPLPVSLHELLICFSLSSLLQRMTGQLNGGFLAVDILFYYLFIY